MSLWLSLCPGCPGMCLGTLPECPLPKKFIVRIKFRAECSGGRQEKSKGSFGGLENSAGTQRSGKEGMLFASSDPILRHEQQQNAAWHRFASSGRVKPRARS